MSNNGRIAARLLAGVMLAASWVMPVLAQNERHAMDSYPAANTVMNGHDTQVFVRFDGPVDHRDAVLEILRGGDVAKALRARLESEPNVLYANAGDLPQGDYTLHWKVHPAGAHDVSQGTLSFKVR